MYTSIPIKYPFFGYTIHANMLEDVPENSDLVSYPHKIEHSSVNFKVSFRDYEEMVF